MSVRRASLLLALVAAGVLGAVALTRPPAAPPEPPVTATGACSSCDARMADKRRLRDFLKARKETAE